MEISVKERGWPGHFICASRCIYRRNTLVSDGERHIIVSSVGGYHESDNKPVRQIGCDRYYETMCFIGKQQGPYIEIEVSRELFDCDLPRGIYGKTAEAALYDGCDNDMDNMHDAIVQHYAANFDAAYAAGMARDAD